MKLLACKKCNDIFNLVLGREKSCNCGEVKGKYINNLDAEYSGDAILIGFANSSFIKSGKMQMMEDEAQEASGKKVCCEGVSFTAFFIPKMATSLNKV